MPRPLTSTALAIAIETPRLRIEPLSARHAALAYAHMQDPAIYEWISLVPPPSVAHLEARWGRVAQALATATREFDLGWAVQRIDDGAWIGKLDADVHCDGVAANVGYLFLRPF